MREKFIVGLDIGTTKVCAVVGRVHGRTSEIIAYGVAPCSGLRKGVVVDMEATVNAIKTAVSEAESASGIGIRAAYVGIAGGHIKCIDSFGATGVKGKEITKSDMERVIESASSVYIPLDRDVLHVIPSDFVIDGQDGIVQPLGMSGVRLEARVNIVTAAHSIVENLVKCVEKAGIKVMDVVLEPIASAGAVLSVEEMDSGALLIDIGGGTTDIAVYKQGRLRHTAVIPIGGNHLTNDIAIGLRLSQNEAERVKRAYGCCLADALCNTEEIDVVSLNGDTKKLPRRLLTEVIRPRCEELLGLVSAEIKGHMLFCAVLTGGTSLLSGLDRLAEAVIGLPVRQGIPYAGTTEDLVYERLKNPSYATAIGLLKYGIREEAEDGLQADLMDKVAGWLRALKVPSIKKSIKVLTSGL